MTHPIDATGEVNFRDQNGQPGRYTIGAHAARDNADTLRAHFDKWHGKRGWTFVSAKVIPDTPPRYTWDPKPEELATLSKSARMFSGLWPDGPARTDGIAVTIEKITKREATVRHRGFALRFTRRKWGQYALAGTTIASNAVLLRFEYREG